MTDSNATSTPRKPEHPIFYSNHDGDCFASCIDMLKRSANFVELMGYIVVDDEDQRFHREGGLSPGAAWAYRQLVRTVTDSIRFATDSLGFNSDGENNKIPESKREDAEDNIID